MRSSRPARTALVLWGFVMLLGPRVARGQAGAVDPSFGANGVVVTTLTSLEDRAHAGALQADGKIVAAGSKFTSGASAADFALVRYDVNGLPDPTFGSSGLVQTAVGGVAAEVYAVAVMPDGRIVAGGSTYTGTGNEYDMVIARYLSDGSLDPSFGSGAGFVSYSNIGPGRGFMRDLLLQPDGKIVVIGRADPGVFALARFEADGSVDTGFGTGGEVLTNLPSSFEEAIEGALLADGRIVAAGTASFQFVVARYLADGSIDATFGVGGFVTTPGPDYCNGMAVAPDGKIVVGGAAAGLGGFYAFTVARYESDGALDATFGTGGIVYTPIGPEDAFGMDVAVQPDGKIVAVGQVDTGTLFTSDFGVVRYLPDGALDAGFGTGGITTTSFGLFASAAPEAVLLQPDGRIVAIGSKPNVGARDFALTRYFGGTCGDGTTVPGEQCDDGNTAAGDCCSPTCEYEAAGSACGGDGDACTHDVCDPTGSCTHPAVTCPLCEICDSAIGCHEAPRPACLGPGPGGRSVLQLKDKSPDTRYAVRWKWRSSTVVTGDFGDPLSEDYALCLYHGSAQSLWLRSLAPAGGTCGSGRPCWKPLSPSGAKYADRELTPNGIASLVLRSNLLQLKLKSKGVQIGLPPLPSLDLPVRAQLQRVGGACWDVTYPTARTSTDVSFGARTP